MKTNIPERLVVIHNEKSSDASRVQHDIFDRLDAEGIASTRFLTPSERVEDNIEAVAQLIQPGDTVVSAAGDGTANAVLNGLLLANEDDVRLGFWGYGNFNDMPHTFNDRYIRRDPLALLSSEHTTELHPLAITKNGEHWRYAGLYATLGWTATAAAVFDDPRVRERLQHGAANLLSSLGRLSLHYLKTRRTSHIPAFYRPDGRLYGGFTDVLAVNGPIMAKIIRSSQDKYNDPDFLLRDLDVSGLLKNSGFLAASALGRMPGELAKHDSLRFVTPSSLPIQVDGEFSQLHDVTSLTISKPEDSPTVTIIEGRCK